jgi:hypothetical protein
MWPIGAGHALSNALVTFNGKNEMLVEWMHVCTDASDVYRVLAFVSKAARSHSYSTVFRSWNCKEWSGRGSQIVGGKLFLYDEPVGLECDEYHALMDEAPQIGCFLPCNAVLIKVPGGDLTDVPLEGFPRECVSLERVVWRSNDAACRQIWKLMSSFQWDTDKDYLVTTCSFEILDPLGVSQKKGKCFQPTEQTPFPRFGLELEVASVEFTQYDFLKLRPRVSDLTSAWGPAHPSLRMCWVTNYLLDEISKTFFPGSNPLLTAVDGRISMTDRVDNVNFPAFPFHMSIVLGKSRRRYEHEFCNVMEVSIRPLPIDGDPKPSTFAQPNAPSFCPVKDESASASGTSEGGSKEAKRSRSPAGISQRSIRSRAAQDSMHNSSSRG